MSAVSIEFHYAGINLDNDKHIKDFNVVAGSTLVQSKSDLTQIPGLIISYEPDCLLLEDHEESRAKNAMWTCYF